MILSDLTLGTILLLLVGATLVGLTLGFRTYARYRGARLVTCPETHQTAAVRVDAAKVAATALIGEKVVQLEQCSRWPEKRNCGQECLSQVNADPAACLVWNIVAEWYKGKSCAYCQKPFLDMHWHDRHPALLSPERNVKQWNEVPPEELPRIFATYLPVCWNCYIAEAFRRQNADRVTNRNWQRGADGVYVPKEEETETKKVAGAS